MKRLDKLLVKSFIGPFIVTFAIAFFVLVMQILWFYLTRIAGKGLSLFQVLELIGYKSVGLIPLALPLSLLISSVMVLGSLAEHYELSSLKSAGVSLLRVMAPMILFGAIGTGISYACSDYIIPAANIQFGARMYDIQQKKPTLSLEPGTFNEDFDQFVIRIGNKEQNGRDISDVQIYDQSRANVNQLGQIIAERGQMFADSSGKFFVMQLENGEQYAESGLTSNKKDNKRNYTYVRTTFDKYTKIFDLSQFELEQTSRNLFSQNRTMLATWQLQEAVDSIDLDILERKQGLSNQLVNHLTGLKRDTIVHRPHRKKGSANKTIKTRKGNSLAERTNQKTKLSDSAKRAAYEHPLVTNATDWAGLMPLFKKLPKNIQTKVMGRARTSIRSILSQSESTNRLMPGISENRVKHVYDLHMKYSMALVCIIFIFIGAPMGAIVRKGGFGYPILVSIIFFVIFIILTISCRKLAESFVLTGLLAGWMPCIILFPVGIFLTNMAMKDKKFGLLSFVSNALQSLKQLFSKK